MSDTKEVKVAVLCANAEGQPEIFRTRVTVTQAQYDNGEHYDTAKASAERNGFEGTMIAFDENDQAARDVQSLGDWFLKS